MVIAPAVVRSHVGRVVEVLLTAVALILNRWGNARARSVERQMIVAHRRSNYSKIRLLGTCTVNMIDVRFGETRV